MPVYFIYSACVCMCYLTKKATNATNVDEKLFLNGPQQKVTSREKANLKITAGHMVQVSHIIIKLDIEGNLNVRLSWFFSFKVANISICIFSGSSVNILTLLILAK